MLCLLVNKRLSSNKQELILIKINYSNNYYYLNKLATYVYTTVSIGIWELKFTKGTKSVSVDIGNFLHEAL